MLATLPDTFFQWIPKPLNKPLVSRDLEFQLSNRYSLLRGDPVPGLISTDVLTLDRFGTTLASTHSNLVNAQYSDLHLIHDYFSPANAKYSTNQAFPGFMMPDPTDTIPTADQSHVDFYLFPTGQNENRGGAAPARFGTAKEDSSTNPSFASRLSKLPS